MDVGAECTEDGWIGATEYAGGNGNTERGRKVRNEMRKGVKDLASAYVLSPRLAEYGVFRFTDGQSLRNNEGIVSGVMTQD